jgi:hypothetical protein
MYSDRSPWLKSEVSSSVCLYIRIGIKKEKKRPGIIPERFKKIKINLLSDHSHIILFSISNDSFLFTHSYLCIQAKITLPYSFFKIFGISNRRNIQPTKDVSVYRATLKNYSTKCRNKFNVSPCDWIRLVSVNDVFSKSNFLVFTSK